jgi:L-histidine N-alpha-methyltransferase
VTRAERSILQEHSEAIIEMLPDNASLVELGSGSAEKTQLLIEAFLSKQDEVVFLPIDISRSALGASARQLLVDHPSLSIVAVEGDYARGLEAISPRDHGPRLIGWLGSSIGNLGRDEAAHFLSELRSDLSPEDRLLVGIDLRKDGATLEKAYDDSEGVTARFNLNLLDRINRELGGSFDTELFEHRATWQETPGRVKSDLVSLQSHSVRIDKLDLIVDFDENEAIHTEYSYKYSTDEIDALAAAARLGRERTWLDAEGQFSVSLFAGC